MIVASRPSRASDPLILLWRTDDRIFRHGVVACAVQVVRPLVNFLRTRFDGFLPLAILSDIGDPLGTKDPRHFGRRHIAEIVRGSILAVHKGQDEAANALALSTFQRYRFVILPQAMRIAFPPLINQFLNFSKNSSLALAIGFAEITSLVNNLFGQSQPAPQLILILMLLYLTLSLVLSAIGNLINRRLQIAGR